MSETPTTGSSREKRRAASPMDDRNGSRPRPTRAGPATASTHAATRRAADLCLNEARSNAPAPSHPEAHRWSPLVRPSDELEDGPPRKTGLRQEPHGGTRVDEVRKVLFGIGRDQDHGRPLRLCPLGEPSCEIEAALLSQLDVDESDVG